MDDEWVLPGEPAPVRLMNTVWADRAGVHDSLATVAELAGWLASVYDQEHCEPLLSELADARDLRDALRSLAAVQTSDTRPAAASPQGDVDLALQIVNNAAAALPAPGLAVTGYGLGLRAVDSDARTTLARVAVEGVRLLGQNPTQLRACQAPGCVLYFVRDHPRREWCSTACGNRARVARHYARHRPGEAVTSWDISQAG